MSDENNNNNLFVPSFFILPFHIMSLDGLTLGYAKVYAFIFEFWNKGRQCYVGNKAIMERTGLAKTQIYEAFAFFERKGELKRVTVSGKRYLIQPEKIIEIHDDDSGGAEIPLPVERNPLSGGAEHNIKKLNKENNNKYIPDFEKSGIKKSEKNKIKDHKKDDRFMQFYNAYPKKVDPQDAYKAFKSVVGDDDVLLESILADIELRKQKHSQWRDKQFIKYPAVYLRKGEFLGEIHNIQDDILAKRQADAQATKERSELQEKASKDRAELERKSQLQKQTDAIAYRQVIKNVPTQMQLSGLQGLKNILRK